jgi:hypothetical protein
MAAMTWARPFRPAGADPIDAARPPCALSEVGGASLGRGLLHGRCEADGMEWLVVRLDAPGSILMRCLLGDLRRVALAVAGEPPRRATVERLVFVPEVGRLCVLRCAAPGTR